MVGVVLLEKMIALSRVRAGQVRVEGHTAFAVADARRLPFEDGRFDAVITESVNVFFDDKQEAVREYAQALALNPTFADIRTRLANTYRDMGDPEQAEREYREAIATNPDYLPARLHLGVTLYSADRREEAEAQWNEVLSRDPENKTAQAYMRMLRAKTSESPAVSENGGDPPTS